MENDRMAQLLLWNAMTVLSPTSRLAMVEWSGALPADETFTYLTLP
jgi:hypothetical protein